MLSISFWLNCCARFAYCCRWMRIWRMMPTGTWPSIQNVEIRWKRVPDWRLLCDHWTRRVYREYDFACTLASRRDLLPWTVHPTQQAKPEIIDRVHTIKRLCLCSIVRMAVCVLLLDAREFANRMGQKLNIHQCEFGARPRAQDHGWRRTLKYGTVHRIFVCMFLFHSVWSTNLYCLPSCVAVCGSAHCVVRVLENWAASGLQSANSRCDDGQVPQEISHYSKPCHTAAPRSLFSSCLCCTSSAANSWMGQFAAVCADCCCLDRPIVSHNILLFDLDSVCWFFQQRPFPLTISLCLHSLSIDPVADICIFWQIFVAKSISSVQLLRSIGALQHMHCKNITNSCGHSSGQFRCSFIVWLAGYMVNTKRYKKNSDCYRYLTL